jgi:exodeoxyribonuclease V alpha subunit
MRELRGQIERITYTNEENGYTVARVRVRGERDLVTVVGNLMAPTPGEELHMSGEWEVHPRYGRQFKVSDYRSAAPASVSGIRKYLGSGLIRGIGPVMAARIVRLFGDKTLDVIEHRIDELCQVEGIGEKRLDMIRRAWEEQKEIREVMIFLQAHGVSANYAAKIFKEYGRDSLEILRTNPYRLATDIFGIGFITADKIAEKLGFSKDSPVRVEAGILYVLNRLADEGHVYYPMDSLVEKCLETLEVAQQDIARAMETIQAEGRIVIEDLSGGVRAVYLAPFHRAEVLLAARLKMLMQAPSAARRVDAQKALAWVQQRLSITLAKLQARAIACALESKVMVITGGPGTGKTTIVNAIIKIASRMGTSVLLAAPTGRAAKRMSEATGREAKTIHRLLEFSPQRGGFQKNEKRPLDCGLLVVDEASMIDTILMHHLVKAVPLTARLILVGDMNQLPSVGAGNVLRDIIDSGAVPVVTLTEIFRQARESLIVVNAHRIRQGIIPPLGPSPAEADFHFLHREDPEAAVKTIEGLVKERIPRSFGLDPMDDIQVLSPMHRGTAGAENLNTLLQAALNPGQTAIVRGNREFRIGDKVMQIRNNYDKEVFNGDIGRIRAVDPDTREVTVAFEGRPVPYEPHELDELVLAYAVSVHKSQGSEYPAVVIPVLTQHYMLLQRNLIYTAVTRGKRLVVLVGTARAMAIAVKNDRPVNRCSALKERLAGRPDNIH